MLRLVRVRGHSMAPSYRDGDYVLTVMPRFVSLKTGDDVVCRTHQGMVLKRVTQMQGSRLSLTGLNGLSIDSSQLGEINVRDVIGRVIRHVPRKRQTAGARPSG